MQKGDLHRGNLGERYVMGRPTIYPTGTTVYDPEK